MASEREVPECVQQTEPVTLDLIPPNEWLDDRSRGICPVCGCYVSSIASYSRQFKLQHQLWHYIIASRVMPTSGITKEDVYGKVEPRLRDVIASEMHPLQSPQED